MSGCRSALQPHAIIVNTCVGISLLSSTFHGFPPTSPRLTCIMTSNVDEETILQEIFAGDDLEDKGIAALVDMLLSDDEEASKWGGSSPGKAPNEEKEFEVSYERLVKDYFSGPASKYSESDFERRFRVNRTAFDDCSVRWMARVDSNEYKDIGGSHSRWI